MDKKGTVEDTISTVVEHLPKTTEGIDNVFSSIIGLFEVVVSPLKLLKEYKDFKMEEFKSKLKNKIKQIPPENIKESLDMNVVGPTLESMKYTLFENDLYEMFAKLLASSIDKEQDVFPSFVEIIRQLSSDEAKMLQYLSSHGAMYPIINLNFKLKDKEGYREIVTNFTNIGQGVCQKPNLISAYLTNLERFGIIKIFYDTYLIKDDFYQPLINDQKMQEYINNNTSNDGKIEIIKARFGITDYGKAFIKACVLEKSE